MLLQSRSGGPEGDLLDEGDSASCSYRPSNILHDPRASYVCSPLEPLRYLLVRARLSIALPWRAGCYRSDPGEVERAARVRMTVAAPSEDYDVETAAMRDFNIPCTLWNCGNIRRTTLFLVIARAKPASTAGPSGRRCFAVRRITM